MFEILKYGWRNMARNKRRSLITLSAIIVATAFLVFMSCLMFGFITYTIDGFTNTFTGKVQAHHPEYRKDRSFYNAIENPEGLMAKAKEHNIMAVPRRYGFGLLAHEDKSAGSMIIGMDPILEKEAFLLPGHIDTGGQFLSNTSKKEIVIGRKLARSLHATVGTELVVIVQAGDGSMGNELLTVSGIFKPVGDEFDRAAAVMHTQDFEELFVANGRVHEIAFNIKGHRLNEQEISTFLKVPNTAVKTWRELFPILHDMTVMADSMMLFFSSIFALAAALGVLNTMLMATHERIREYGMLKAIGTTPLRLFIDTSIEAILLGVIGATIGCIIGTGIAFYFETYGWDLTRWLKGVSFAGIAFDPVWRAAIEPYRIIVPGLMMAGISWLISLYPAIVVARINTIKAIHHE